MPNLAEALKSEIARIARKENRGEFAALKKATSLYRSEIAALKRRAQALEQEVRRLRKSVPEELPRPKAEPAGEKHRFSAKGLMSQRQRLGLSAADVGLLVGASSQSVYNWEAGSSRPREKHLPALAALRNLGKKQAAAVLAQR